MQQAEPSERLLRRIDELAHPLLRHVEMTGDQRVGVDQLFDIEQFGPQHHIATGRARRGSCRRPRSGPLVASFVARESAAWLFMAEMRKVVEIEFVEIKVVAHIVTSQPQEVALSISSTVEISFDEAENVRSTCSMNDISSSMLTPLTFESASALRSSSVWL